MDGQPRMTAASLYCAACHTTEPRRCECVAHEGPNVRHERQTQAQLEAVRSMEGLGVTLPSTARLHRLNKTAIAFERERGRWHGAQRLPGLTRRGLVFKRMVPVVPNVGVERRTKGREAAFGLSARTTG